MDDRRWLGIALATAGTLVLSSESVVLRWISAGAAPPGQGTVLWCVGLATTAVAASISLVRLGARGTSIAVRRGGADLWWAGGLQGTSTLLFVLAIASTAVADVVAVLAAAPLCTALVAVIWLGERPSRRVWLGIAASAVGVAVVAWGSLGGGSALGVLAALGAVLAFAVSVSVLRRRDDLDRFAVVAVAGGCVALAATPFARPGELDARSLALVVLLGAVIGPTSRWMLSSAPRYLPASQIGLFIPIETVAATTWAYLAFDEVPVAGTWLGGALVLIGVVVAVVEPAGPFTPRTASSPPPGSAAPRRR